MRTTATAFAPATVANVAVGFDLLGFPIDGVGDRVTVTRTSVPGELTLEPLEGDPGIVSAITRDPAKNTATAGLLLLLRERSLPFGFRVQVKKGIPLGSGMGGSAASAAAGIVAASALLERPLSREELLRYALEGEAAASGAKHGDNLAPSLFGGLMLCRSLDPPELIPLPVPAGIHAVVVYPGVRLDTRDSRAVLRSSVTLPEMVHQSSHLAGFLTGCFQGDLELIRRSMIDQVIEPQRAHLIPGFREVQKAALKRGALGCSISGSGPSVFAWVRAKAAALEVREAMEQAFREAGARSLQSWISPIRAAGAVLE